MATKKVSQSLLTLYYFSPEVDTLTRIKNFLDPRVGNPIDIELESLDRAQLYLPEPSRNPPPWAPVLKGYSNKIDTMLNASHSAIVTIRVEDRVFAATFGRAQHFLPRTRIVRNFGLRTVINAVSPESLNSIDMKSFESMALHTRVQASTKSPLRHFGIDWTRDLLRAVTGIPVDSTFAKRLSGADSLVICGNQELRAAPSLCRTALRYYSSDAYKDTQWSFIDFLQPEMDPVILEHLDGSLANAIMHSSGANPPNFTIDEILDYAGVDCFSIQPSRRHRTENLDLHQLRTFIRQHDQKTPLEWLREASVRVTFADVPSGAKNYRVYNSLDWSTRYHERLYVFSSGIWLRVKQEYAEQLDACISKIGEPSRRLPLAPQDVMLPQRGVPNEEKGEGQYVNMVASDKFSFLKMHPASFRSELMNEEVEPCDILGAQGALYYVKRGGASSGLSHLFSQGRAAALTLMKDAGYRRLFREAVVQAAERVSADADEAALFAEEYTGEFSEDGFLPQNVEVCFVVIRRTDAGWPRDIPYLSKVSLYEAYRHLSSAKFRVTLQCVTPAPHAVSSVPAQIAPVRPASPADPSVEGADDT